MCQDRNNVSSYIYMMDYSLTVNLWRCLVGFACIMVLDELCAGEGWDQSCTVGSRILGGGVKGVVGDTKQWNTDVDTERSASDHPLPWNCGGHTHHEAHHTIQQIASPLAGSRP
eukprot:GHVQ01021104.1.p2 GENE.GHVQ01021104.1~~GHVQ01021104.1.p2  ORF type:complete len:114 (-),score=23.79 GHVQ01021104.1:98-439(-)